MSFRKNMINWHEFRDLSPKKKASFLTNSTGVIQCLNNTQQMDKELINRLIDLAELIRTSSSDIEFMNYLRGILATKSCALYFTQCSTRTFTSFSIATQSLGMMVEEIRNPEMSAMYKGEAELDTLLSLAHLTDIIVMRQMDNELVDRVAFELVDRGLPTRLINGGSGSDQHPTQALLELYTLISHLDIQKDSEKKYTVAFVGDLKRSRTARSLSYLLALYPAIKQIFVAPEELQMKRDITEYLDEHNIEYSHTESLDDTLSQADVFYMMRIQDEYSSTSESLRREYEQYYLSLEKVKRMKNDAHIIHPLPRRLELPIEIDKDPRAKYWSAVYRGKLIRMALLLYMFGKGDIEKLKARIY